MPSGGDAMRCCYPLLGPKETGLGESAHTFITLVPFVSPERNISCGLSRLLRLLSREVSQLHPPCGWLLLGMPLALLMSDQRL